MILRLLLHVITMAVVQDNLRTFARESFRIKSEDTNTILNEAFEKRITLNKELCKVEAQIQRAYTILKEAYDNGALEEAYKKRAIHTILKEAYDNAALEKAYEKRAILNEELDKTEAQIHESMRTFVVESIGIGSDEDVQHTNTYANVHKKMKKEHKTAQQKRKEYLEIAEKSKILDGLERTSDGKASHDVFMRWRRRKECEQMHREIRYAMARKYNTPLKDLPTETLDEVFEKWQRAGGCGTKEACEQWHKEIRDATARRYNIPLEDLPDRIPLSYSSDVFGIPQSYFGFVHEIVKNKRDKYLGLE